MMESNDVLKNYAYNERIFHAEETNITEKSASWRRQLLLLQHSLRNASTNDRRQTFAHHFAKLDKDFSVKENVAHVEQILQVHESIVSAETSTNCVNMQLLENLNVEQCNEAFLYESCKSDEVTNADLQYLRKKSTANDVFVDYRMQQNSVPALPTKTTAPQQRNTLSHFLDQTHRANKQPTTIKAVFENPNKIINKLEPTSLLPNDNVDNKTNSNESNVGAGFRTAREELHIQKLKKHGGASNSASHGYNPAQQLYAFAGNQTSTTAPVFNYGATKKSLGARRTVRDNFVPPVRPEDNAGGAEGTPPSSQSSDLGELDERLINIDPKMIELISNEIMHKFKPVAWQDIAGLEYAKSIIKEAVVYPMLRPDIFTGLRRPPRGILLFGPPGTGKTLIGKCIASQSKSTFFSISASSLTSKWVGESEKMVRALFAVAAVHQPSVVFIDEIDSLLSQRSESEHECSRRLKTEFLIQLDGAATSEDDRVLIVAATNRPQELDEAARRRLVKRLYIPLPEQDARVQILSNLLQTVRNSLDEAAMQEVGRLTDGYSGADMDSLCREASMEPIRSIPFDEIPHFKEDNVRPVNIDDFRTALQKVRPSVSQDDLKQYIEWNNIYGAGR